MKRVYKWIFPESVDVDKASQLAAEINVSPSLAAILCQREIDSFDKAKSYFRPTLEDLHDPFLFKDMDKAVNRIIDAIHEGQHIMVYGDYDVDGTTSVALVYSFLSQYYQNLSFYIPDRYNEGYGVSFQSIDHAEKENVGLIIALDCGIKATDKVAYANEKGIDFIICDHHRPGDKLPEAVAVLDQKRNDCNYPYKELSGCGVGFKLMQAFAQQQGIEEEAVYQFLDYLAISIAADIVPITGENRILAYYGLRLINERPRPGIACLKELAGFEKSVNITNVVFGFAPRINAAGRMGDAKNAVKLLLAKDMNEAYSFGAGINKDNTDRKDLDKAITEQVIQMIEKSAELTQAKTTVLYDESWHKGVLGIVASRSIESYYRPTIILTKSKGVLAGSARSVSGFDVYDAIEACEEHLIQFGGHKYAAGLTMKEEQLPDFQKAFEAYVSSTITEEQLTPKIKVDAEIALKEITFNYLSIIQQMEPFGPQNMQPVFVSRGVVDSGYSKIVGETHLKLSIQQGDSEMMDGIAFGMGENYEQIQTGQPFDICYSIEENEWNGNVRLQLRVRDIKFGA